MPNAVLDLPAFAGVGNAVCEIHPTQSIAGCMRLEHWDPIRKKYLLYLPSTGQREADCGQYPYEQIPRRIFLDTNVINLLVKWRAQVFDHEPIPDEIDDRLAFDIEALMHVFYVGSSARWDLVGSPKTLASLRTLPTPSFAQTCSTMASALLTATPTIRIASSQSPSAVVLLGLHLSRRYVTPPTRS